MSAEGCGIALRLSLALTAFVVAGVFVRWAVWFHRNYDAIIRIPFVWGCVLTALFIAAIGIKQLWPRNR